MEPEELREFAVKQNYLAIDVTGTSFVFTSLRDVEKELNIDHSTISKKLKLSNKGDVFTNRITKECYFIKRVDNSQENLNDDVDTDPVQLQKPDEPHV